MQKLGSNLSYHEYVTVRSDGRTTLKQPDLKQPLVPHNKFFIRLQQKDGYKYEKINYRFYIDNNKLCVVTS